MKQYLLDFFQFNNWANQKVLVAIHTISEKDEPVKLFSHLINSQKKWMNRIKKEKDDNDLSWDHPVYLLNDCQFNWETSLRMWTDFIQSLNEETLNTEIHYNATDGGSFTSTILDIALQLNYHSIHHRAQIVRMIRAQGVAPPPIEYIFMTRKTKDNQ